MLELSLDQVHQSPAGYSQFAAVVYCRDVEICRQGVGCPCEAGVNVGAGLSASGRQALGQDFRVCCHIDHKQSREG